MAPVNPAWQPGTEPSFPRGSGDPSKGMQRLFLQRLRRLTWLRRSCTGQLEDSVLRVLDRAIYSTYCDCMELGIDEEARELLKQAS